MRRPGCHHTKGKELLACSQARHYLNAPFWWLSREGSLGQDPGGVGHEVERLPPLPGQLPASLLSAPQGLSISLAGFLMKRQGEKKPMAASWGLLCQVPPSSSSEGQDAESGVNAELRPTIPTTGNLVHLSNKRKQEAPGPPPARAHTSFLVLSRPTHPHFRCAATSLLIPWCPTTEARPEEHGVPEPSPSLRGGFLIHRRGNE